MTVNKHKLITCIETERIKQTNESNDVERATELTGEFPGNMEEFTLTGTLTDADGQRYRFAGALRLPDWLRQTLDNPIKVAMVKQWANFGWRMVTAILVALVVGTGSIAVKMGWMVF